MVKKAGGKKGVATEEWSLELSDEEATTIDVLLTDRISIDQTMKMAIKHCQEMLTGIVRGEKEFWDDMLETHGLDTGKYDYRYRVGAGKVLRAIKEGGHEQG